jgi:hypothetical protein
MFIAEGMGYHYFLLGEEACVLGQTVKCLNAELCNANAPYTQDNESRSAWVPTGYQCDYDYTMPEPIYCNYLITDDVADLPAMLPGDRICDYEDLPEVTYWNCNDPSEGGFKCTLNSPFVADITPETIAEAWTATVTTDDVFMILPFDGPMFSEPVLDMDCYDWLDATDEFAEFPYFFQLSDFACDVGMVFECIDDALCNTVQPSADYEEMVWYALPFKKEP